ncbi:PaaI family thioesterase [Aliikangiella marina]|uniref:Medium/long-chain acyl-CoA thioesterase YigI n=1 Tax=Aliikangiella marina TaxID=1712262 RepID=A0A545T4N7_9GAMM|nr:PaaI family thioesterase [Aliikangiella marina]TQV72190.1 PaaI family thioesterase [Aliikangiella marina]
MSTSFDPKDPNYAERVSNSFKRQKVMATLNAKLESVAPGEVEISFPYHEDFTQQHGFIHAGISSTILDSACGYAAFSLMPADAAVLSIEFKTNLLSPAKGEKFIAKATVIKPGKTITVTEAKLFAVSGESIKLIASMNGTMMAVFDRPAITQ